MKMKILLTYTLFLFSGLLYSQPFEVTVTSSEAKSCIDSVVQFTAATTDGGTIVTGVEYTWYFEDGTKYGPELDLDTVEHTFIQGGGQILRVEAEKDADSDYALVKYEVALEPSFYGTKTNKGEDPICLGQQVILTGVINDSTWRYNIPDTVTVDPLVISDTKAETIRFDYRIFEESDAISTGNEIESVSIKLEHTNLSQVKIELICPNDKSIILKDFGGEDVYLGEPIDNENSVDVGESYLYTWDNSATTTMNDASVTAVTSLPEGIFQPNEAFSNLSNAPACPLNGIWQIKVSDETANDKGHMIEGQLKFSNSVLPLPWEIIHDYDVKAKYKWEGDGYVSSTGDNGLAYAIPDDRFNYVYTYSRMDDFGCWQDTSVNVRVSRPEFKLDPDSASGEFDFTVTFVDTTAWAEDFIWDFGDGSEWLYTNIDDTAKVQHIYTFEGEFEAYMIATAEDGCTDTSETQKITVKIPEPDFDPEDIPNAFVPDGSIEKAFDLEKEGGINGENVAKFDCWIYNRTGKKVHEYHGPNTVDFKWDGTINGGQLATPGVYYYYMIVKEYNGQEISAKGFIHLFRRE